LHSSLVAVTKLLAISSAQSLLFLLRISFDVDATFTVAYVVNANFFRSDASVSIFSLINNNKTPIHRSTLPGTSRAKIFN